MKTFGLISAASIAFAVLSTVAVAGAQIEATGFRGLDWGTPFEAVAAEMQLDQTVGGLSRYHRPGDKMAIGEAELVFIGYEFYKGRFMAVTMKSVDNARVSRAMIESFRAQFGPGYQSNRFIQSYQWGGNTTNISLSCNDVSQSCMGIMTSPEIFEEYQADRAAAAAGSGKDF